MKWYSPDERFTSASFPSTKARSPEPFIKSNQLKVNIYKTESKLMFRHVCESHKNGIQAQEPNRGGGGHFEDYIPPPWNLPGPQASMFPSLSLPHLHSFSADNNEWIRIFCIQKFFPTSHTTFHLWLRQRVGWRGNTILLRNNKWRKGCMYCNG